ncbi:poly-gamma-glutamate hydrolase family protein [Desulfosoma caldarium]|nr:poly-gamma-glutamate hydrolase family protein [Desulfosoma caldarium]
MNSYESYYALVRREVSGRDYVIEWRTGRSGLAVMAPHGGGIEPGTSEVARSIAQGSHSFYHFDGLKRENNGTLHITSTRFDEPVALALAAVSWKIVTIHGCTHDDVDIYLGGLDTNFQAACAEALTNAGFIVACHLDFQGLQPENLCNRGRSGKGLQLELSLRLRRRLFHRLNRAGRQQPTALFGLLNDTLRRVLAREAFSDSFSHVHGILSS